MSSVKDTPDYPRPSVFILEDDPTRVDYLLQVLTGCDLTITDTCKKAYKFRPPYDLILLDHDLGGRQMTKHEDNGFNFLLLIEDQINVEATIICHSYNPDARKRMVDWSKGTAHDAPFRSGAFNRLIQAWRHNHGLRPVDV